MSAQTPRRRTGRPNDGGFTLIELLVVVVILGILSAVVVFAVRGVGDKGKEAAYTTGAKTIRTAEEAYCLKNGNYGTEDELVAGGFLSEPSEDHQVDLGAGPCKSSGNVAKSGFTISAQALADQQQTLTLATPGDVYITRNRELLGMWPDNANICEPLLGVGQDLSTVGILATKTTFISPNTFRFELRQGVKFQDGQDFNAAAVKYSYERVVAKSLGLTSFLGPNSVAIVDNYTVDVTPTKANLRLPEIIAHPNFSIIAPGSNPVIKPVCTGPFEFESYAPNDRFVAKRFDGYWGPKAKLRQLTFRFIPDQNTRRLALESGEVDGIYFLAPQQVASVRARPDLVIAPTPPGASVVLSMNLHGPAGYQLMQDIDLRHALALSLEPQKLASIQWQNTAQVINTVSPPAILGSEAARVGPITGNLVQSEQTLESKGWVKGADGIRAKAGQRLELVTPAQFDFEPESLQFIQAQARLAGIDLKVMKAANGAAYSKAINGGQWDVDINYWNQNDGNPASIPARLWYGKNTAARIQWTGAGPAFDALVDDALATPDHQVSIVKSVDATKLLVETMYAAIPLTSFPQIFALKKSVAGFVPHPSVNQQPLTSVYRTK